MSSPLYLRRSLTREGVVYHVQIPEVGERDLEWHKFVDTIFENSEVPQITPSFAKRGYRNAYFWGAEDRMLRVVLGGRIVKGLPGHYLVRSPIGLYTVVSPSDFVECYGV